jgi:predicted ATP-grasp superfamily ATP-dependent carboligase
MTRILVYEPLSAGDPGTTAALGRDSRARQEMVEAGRSMRDAMAADLAALEGVEVTVAVARQEASLAGLPTHVRAIEPRPGEGAVAFTCRQAPLHDLCWIVAPESGGLLLRLHEAVGDARWIGCSAEAISLAASKRATCEALHAAGVATPLAFASTGDGAWIVKPDDGAGTQETRFHATRAAAEADLRRRQDEGRSAVAQPFVPGEALSLSLVVGPDLARVVAFNRQQVQIDAAGWLHDLGVQAGALRPPDPRILPLRALAQKVAAAVPGLRGYVGIDVVWNERKGVVVIEVNPRVTCAYVGLSAALGRNLAADILAAHPRSRVPEAAGHGVA